MSDSRRSAGNGAAVAIVMVFGIVILAGVVLVTGVTLWEIATPLEITHPVNVNSFAATPTPVAAGSAAQVEVDPLDAATATSESSPTRLPIEVNAQDQIMVNGAIQSLDDLKKTFSDIKNGNSTFTDIKIKFAGSSDEKMAEVFAILKEACILYEVDPAGKVPAEAATP